jgi:hypothetical protein
MPLRAAQGESCISFFNEDKLNDEKQLRKIATDENGSGNVFY